jgi:hypothetical protein
MTRTSGDGGRPVFRDGKMREGIESAPIGSRRRFGNVSIRCGHSGCGADRYGPGYGDGKESGMKKGDLKMKAIGLAVAGVLAGSRLMTALPKDEAKGEGKKGSAGDEKKDKAQASTDKHVCKGQNACKGQGGCKSGDAGCAGKNSCKGKGGCAVPVAKKAA